MPASVTLQRAQQLFALVNGKLCCPASALSPCIPFLYPDDGCWGRAHEMCRIMIADGADPEKVWIFGSLHVNTRNNPACGVNWGWHVAPTLQVTAGGVPQTYVIDPSLFEGPVTQAVWASVQTSSPVLIPSPASTFFRNQSGSIQQTDPAYTQTDIVLSTYRNNLRLRSASQGPPPYFGCMVKPTGTQWFGTIAGNTTQSWYTWGWSAASHVFWHLMPLTPCPGGPQLSWKVKVERASATQCTHWITVVNHTPDPIRFEGRFNVLS